MTRTKTRSSRPAIPPQHAFTKLTAAAADQPQNPSPDTIARKLEPYQPKTLTGVDADAVLERNGIPAAAPASPPARSGGDGLPGGDNHALAPDVATTAETRPRRKPAKKWDDETMHEAAAGLAQDAGRALRWCIEKIGEAVIRVASHFLAATIYGMSVVVFILTIYEIWTPAKFIADAVAAAAGL
jgi:hypothetical protein